MRMTKIAGVAFWVFAAYVVLGAVFLPAASVQGLGTAKQVAIAALGIAWFLALLGASASGMVYLAARAAGGLPSAPPSADPHEDDTIVPFGRSPESEAEEPSRKVRAS